MADQLPHGRAGLPEDEAALWKWLLAQDSTVATGLIACCLANTPPGAIYFQHSAGMRVDPIPRGL